MQKYHSNATTNKTIRTRIKHSDGSQKLIASHYGVNVKTVAKWRTCDSPNDKSSRPHRIHYALSHDEKEIICVIRCRVSQRYG